MNFFNRMLGRGYEAKKIAKKLPAHRQQLNQAAAIVIGESGLNLATASRRDRSVLAAFYFGIVSAHGRQHGLKAEEVNALCLCGYRDIFKFDDRFAISVVDECDRANSSGEPATVHSIIQRGITAHAHLIAGHRELFRQNLLELLAHFKNAGPAEG